MRRHNLIFGPGQILLATIYLSMSSSFLLVCIYHTCIECASNHAYKSHFEHQMYVSGTVHEMESYLKCGSRNINLPHYCRYCCLWSTNVLVYFEVENHHGRLTRFLKSSFWHFLSCTILFGCNKNDVLPCIFVYLPVSIIACSFIVLQK